MIEEDVFVVLVSGRERAENDKFSYRYRYLVPYHPGDKNSTESDFLVISENLRFFSIYLLIFNFGP